MNQGIGYVKVGSLNFKVLWRSKKYGKSLKMIGRFGSISGIIPDSALFLKDESEFLERNLLVFDELLKGKVIYL